MREPRTVALFLEDILTAATDIRSFTRGMTFEDFVGDKRTRHAVIRNLEVVGEAVKNLPEELKRAHPDVNWRAMAAMRDRLIHAYFGSSDRIVWDTVTIDIPLLEGEVKRMLEEFGRVP